MKISVGAAGLAAVASALIGYSVGKRLHAPAIDEGSAPAKYEVAFLEIEYPDAISDKESIMTTLHNDVCIERAIRNTEKKLYICIHVDEKRFWRNDGTYCSAAVKQYISDIYAQTWDLAIVERKLQLDVRIFTSLPGETCYLKRESVLLFPDLEAIYCDLDCRLKDFEAVSESRKSQMLPLFEIIPLQKEAEKFYDGSYYYYDDCISEVPKYDKVMLGGTFDNLHNGHKKLLTLAASICKKQLFVGVMSDNALKHKKNFTMIKCVSERIRCTKAFLDNMFPNLETKVACIEDGFGPSITDPNYDALVVSSETVPGGKRINEIRIKKGWKPLSIAVTRRTAAAMLSSTFIRDNFRKFSTKPKC